MKVDYVPSSFVQQQWHLVGAYLAAALQYAHGDITLDQLRSDLSTNRMSLYKWLHGGRVTGAAAVVFQNKHNARVAFVVAIGGKDIFKQDAWDQFCELLRRNGATKVAGAMRDSMIRLTSRVGFKKKYTIAEADL